MRQRSMASLNSGTADAAILSFNQTIAGYLALHLPNEHMTRKNELDPDSVSYLS